MYQHDIRMDFLPFMESIANHDNKKSNVVFLESVVQHWSTSAGDYSKNVKNQNGPSCKPPLNYTLSENGDWRNYIVPQQLATLKSEHMTLLPVAEALIGGVNYHMSASDCTHICFFPSLFQFEWHALKLITLDMLVWWYSMYSVSESSRTTYS